MSYPLKQRSVHSSALGLLVSSLLTFFSFILYAAAEEYLYKHVEGFQFNWFLTCVELTGFTCLCLLLRVLPPLPALSNLQPSFSTQSHRKKRPIPLSCHAFIAFFMTFAKGFAGLSLLHLNYPTQVILKSFKLLFVVFGGVLFLHKPLNPRQFLSYVLLVLSGMLFSLGEAQHSAAEFNLIGFVYILISLCCDALHTNLQEYVLKQHDATISDVVLYTNGFGSLFVLCLIVVNGELAAALRFLHTYASVSVGNAIWICAVISMKTALLFIGVLSITYITKYHSVVTAYIVTTLRKIATILISFLLFPKAFSETEAVALVLFVLYVSAQWNEIRERKSEKYYLPVRLSK